jgi:mRNA interferase RelE/StbE
VRRVLRWSPRAERDLSRIERTSPRDARRIHQAAAQYAATGHGDALKLTAQDGIYRLRVGEWRVLFSFEDGGFVVLALRVLNRRDAYR